MPRSRAVLGSPAGSPLGSPATIAKMLDFWARHGIEAMTEHFPLSDVDTAVAHLREGEGEAHYRAVLDNELT